MTMWVISKVWLSHTCPELAEKTILQLLRARDAHDGPARSQIPQPQHPQPGAARPQERLSSSPECAEGRSQPACWPC
jgi:hypothetical protein